MKRLLTLYLLFFVFFASSQTKTNGTGTKQAIKTSPQVTPGKYSGNKVHNLVSSLKHDTCLDKKFSIVFYIVLDSNYTVNSTTPATLTMLMDTLNDRFKNICVSFVNCSTVFIPNYTFNKWSKGNTESIVTGSYYTDKTINFYIVDTIKTDASNDEAEGYTYEPSTINLTTPHKDVIVCERWRLLLGRCVTPLHLFGHFFGLPHTFDEKMPVPAAVPAPPTGVLSQEFANASFPNCRDHGDGFCDTEADPGPSYALFDGNGQFYVPPLDNYMSYYNATRCRFTQQQYYHMAYTIVTKRLYLH